MFLCYYFKWKNLNRLLKQKEKKTNRKQNPIWNTSVLRLIGLCTLQDTGTAEFSSFHSFRRDQCGPGKANVSRDTDVSYYLFVTILHRDVITLGISLCRISENVLTSQLKKKPPGSMLQTKDSFLVVILQIIFLNCTIDKTEFSLIS